MFAKPSGVDICHSDSHAYIIRSDKNEYFRIGDLTTNSDVSKFNLSPACRDGDHYFACGSNKFYVIKGDEYRCVTNMNQDGSPKVYTLHPNCRGGDFYVAVRTGWFKYTYYFYIIFLERGVYRRVSNLNQDADAVEYNLHNDCKSSFYYWGNKGDFCFLKNPSKWGFEFFQTDNMNQNTNSKRFGIHNTVLKLLVDFECETKDDEELTEKETLLIKSNGGTDNVNKMCPPPAESLIIAKNELDTESLPLDDNHQVDAAIRRKKLNPVESFG